MPETASAGWRAEYRHQDVDPDYHESDPHRSLPRPAARTPATDLSIFIQS